MRNFGTPYQLDLTSDGATQVALTPGTATQSATFNVPAPKGSVDDNWPIALNTAFRLQIVFDQAAAGGSAVDTDQLHRAIQSVDYRSDVFGSLYRAESTPGPVLQHVIGFVAAGYAYASPGRAQIGAGDGDTTLQLYFTLPHSHEFMQKPHHSSPWLGWLVNSQLQITIAASNVYDSLSTGAVTKGACNLQSWIEYAVSDELFIPYLAQWGIYEAPAAGGTTALLQGIGAENGLKGVKTGSRIAAIFELSDQAGMGAADGPDNITSVHIPQLGQDQTTHIDGFFLAYRRAMGGRRGYIGESGVGNNDQAGNPYLMTSGANGRLNVAQTMYTPWKAPGKEQQMSKLPKFAGDLKIIRSFTAAPASGRHRFVLCEMREFTPQQKGDLLQRAGRARNTPIARMLTHKNESEVIARRRGGKLDVLAERVL